MGESTKGRRSIASRGVMTLMQPRATTCTFDSLLRVLDHTRRHLSGRAGTVWRIRSAGNVREWWHEPHCRTHTTRTMGREILQNDDARRAERWFWFAAPGHSEVPRPRHGIARRGTTDIGSGSSRSLARNLTSEGQPPALHIHWGKPAVGWGQTTPPSRESASAALSN